MNRPGRPPLDPRDPSVRVCLTLPSKRYDALYRSASVARISIPELIRQRLKKYPMSAKDEPAR